MGRFSLGREDEEIVRKFLKFKVMALVFGVDAFGVIVDHPGQGDHELSGITRWCAGKKWWMSAYSLLGTERLT